MRALAQRSAGAAKEIKGLISTSATQVGEGVQLVAETGSRLGRIEQKVAEIDKVVAEIAVSAHEQAAGLRQISAAMAQMDRRPSRTPRCRKRPPPAAVRSPTKAIASPKWSRKFQSTAPKRRIRVSEKPLAKRS